ncbi:sodium channel and clathrin linker 1 [Megalops cyprinoides]|uniref:sodium channel and clathrin linker 1 n=1 Tax=Megalops cyprinoides TaxID=118141 RepID=UPI0018656545|nr:sodium channel and clathrin linker 1 [Megalops cyprinoides]
MSAEIESLRDEVHRLKSALSQYQDGHQAPAASALGETSRGSDSPAFWLSDKNIMAPLVAEYDRHVEDMKEQLQRYQMQMTELKVKLEEVVDENERLHSELRESIERQLHTLPIGSGLEVDSNEEGIMRNLQEQIQLSVQEKDRAMEMWRSAADELYRLQETYQKTSSDVQVHMAERQHMKNQLTNVQQAAQQLQVANQNLESTNQEFLKTVTEQNAEMEELRTQLRQAKLDLRTATAKVEEMTKLMQNVQDQMQRREDEAAEAHGREEASDRRLQQLQSALSQLEGRLKAATQETESVRREQATRERQVGELQGRCTSLEEEKYEAMAKVRESIQAAEEASLQKEQALLREKQKSEELEKLKEAIKQLIQDAAVRTRKEVENVRKQCNIQIQRMAEELSALQLECADKESQIERTLRERKAVEEELEKVYREGRSGEPEYRKMDTLHQRCLNAERMKDDLQITLQTTQNRMKKLEMDYEEELSRCQEEVRRLQGALAGARDDCGSVSEERLRLQQENQKLHREMEELRKTSQQIQRKAKQQVSSMEHEFSLKEQGLEARLRELEEGSRNSSVELNRLLTAQQKTTRRWKEEARKLAEAFEQKLGSLRAELARQKQRSQELEIQLEADHEKIVEYERQMVEYQEKNGRLQRRLTQAEQRASTASQQLSIITSHRRKAASMLDLESL